MQQAITWVNVDPDLCCHMASLGHNVLTHWGLVTQLYLYDSNVEDIYRQVSNIRRTLADN